MREIIEGAAEAAGVELREGYSGRGMYGEECFGIVCDSLQGCVAFLFAVANEDRPLAEDLAGCIAEDSMAFQRIYYFPGFELEDE